MKPMKSKVKLLLVGSALATLFLIADLWVSGHLTLARAGILLALSLVAPVAHFCSASRDEWVVGSWTLERAHRDRS